jgi:hypothetical protein
MKSDPRFVVVSFARDQAAIVVQGTTSMPVFQRELLERYEITGERYHPGAGATVHGALLAVHESGVVTVPIWTWRAADGSARFLCQASDDGSAPAFSVLALSEAELAKQVTARLRPAGN